MKEKRLNGLRLMCLTAIFMAMNVAFSSFGIPVPAGRIYLCDAVICTAALSLNPLCAFFVGGVGSFLGDFFFYPAAMFVSLVVHGLQGIMISLIGRKTDSLIRKVFAVCVGAIIMVVGYTLGCVFVYGTPEGAIINIPYEALQATVGGVLGLLVHKRIKF